jgi:hypothetical protein
VKQVREQQTAHTPAAHNPAPDQKARETPILATPLILLFAFVFVLLLIRLRAMLPEQAREQQTAQTPTTHNPAPDQQARETPIPATLILLFVFALIFLLTRSCAARPEQASAQQATAAATSPRDEQTGKATLFATTFFPALILILALRAFPQGVRQQQIADPPPPQNAAADQQAHDLLFVSAAPFVRVNFTSLAQQRVDRHYILLSLRFSACR